MTESRTSFFRQIQQEIEDKKLKDDQKAAAESERKTKGSELYSAMRRIAKSCGEQQTVSVGAGSRFPGIHGHRLKQTSRWVTPLVEIETEEGNVNMQILETEPDHAENNLYRPLGFIILMNGKLLSSAEPSGEVINWLGEKASSDQIELIKDNVLPLMEEAYARLSQPERTHDVSAELNVSGIFEGRAPSRFHDPKTGNYVPD